MTTYAERLQTFEGLWDEHQTTARQLAAIGHICDKPPLEVLDDGSRCISCGAFVKKDHSIRALGDTTSHSTFYHEDFDDFNFHRPECIRLQVRIPLEPQAQLMGLYSNRFENLRSKWERRSSGRYRPAVIGKLPQSSSLFSLPTEIRLEIYAMILPSFDEETEIVTLHGESARVITKQGYGKTGPRDLTKPNILRTCRTVNEEAMDLIYSHTCFKFRSTKVMYLFLRSIGKAGRRLIKAVDIYCGGREDAIAFAMLASCEQLRAITIRLPRPMMLFSKPPPIWVLDGISCLLSLSGLEEVSFGDCGPRINSMSDEKPDAAIIRKELTRPRGSPGDDSVIKAYLDP
jgi:hypothetical protein